MRKILYILALLPLFANAQMTIHGNANEVFMGAYYHNYINSTRDTTVTVNPTDANIVIKNFSGSASGASVGSTTSLAMFRNSSFNGIMMGSFGSSPANGFSFYAWGGNNVTRTVTPASSQFLIMGFNGYDGSSSASGGLLQFIAPIGWTNTTGGHLMNFEFRATSYLDNTARPRIFWNSALESLYGNSRGTGRFALGLFEITRPYAKFHVDGTNVLDTIAYYRALSGNRSPFALYSVGNTLVASIDSAGNHIVPKVYVTNATTATEVDSIVVKQNGEYVAALASSVFGGKVDSVTKSNDTFYYWKGATKYFAGLDATAGGGGGEANTASNLGGGLANFDGKSGVDLRFNSFNASHFDLASNLISIDAAVINDIANGVTAHGWGDHAAAGYALASSLGTTATTNDYNDLDNLPTLFSGAYADLTGIPSSFTPASHTHAQSDITDLTTDLAGKQASDADLTAIAGLAPTNDDVIQRKAGAWTNRTMAQLKTDLALVKGDVGLGSVDNTSDATKNSAAAVLTNKDLTSGTNTFPTFNQNTTGSAATLTTTRTIWGQNFNGSANVTGDITLGTANITMTGSIGATGARVTKGWFTDGEFTNVPTVGGVALPTAASTTTLTNKTIAYGSNTITGLPVEIGVAVSDETTAITTGTAKVTFRMPHAMTVTAVRANVNTASSSGTPTVDINENGSSILGTKLTIDASEKTSTTAASAATITDASLADDAEITIDIDVAGTGAKGLKVWIIGTR
jgi:hypothetical protein